MTDHSTIHGGKAKVLFINQPFAARQEVVDRLNEVVEITQAGRDSDAQHSEQLSNLVKSDGPFLAAVWFYNPLDKTAFPTLDETTLSPLLSTGTLYLSTFGAGYNHVSLSSLPSFVTYANNPISPGIRTADSTASMILTALRGSWGHDKHIREGGWVKQGDDWVAKDARRSTAGVVGMGRIGRLVAEHLSHFGMKIIYSQRTRLSPELERDYDYVSLNELYSRSDVITIHCPLTEATKGMVDDAAFAKMKDGVIFINTSRGPVVDEPSLVRALESRKVLRAALDVFEEEPKVHPGLIASDHTLLLPHVAVVNNTMSEEMQEEILQNLELWVREGKARTAVVEPKDVERKWLGLKNMGLA